MPLNSLPTMLKLRMLKTRISKLRTVAALLTVAAASLLVGASLKAQSGTAPLSPSSAKTTEQAFKNIQVLKGIPSDQLIPAMQFMTSSLGVQCDFCHMEGSFDKDDKKPKQIARKMMQMMIIINQENFDSHREVTCFTCHRGSPKPVAIPIINAEVTPPFPQGLDEEVPPSNLPSVDQILDKYVQAVGGNQALLNSRSRIEHGKISFGPRQFPVDILIQSPDKSAVVTHLPNGENSTVYNGPEGWSSAPGRPPRGMSASDLASAKLDADLQFPADAKKVFKELRVEREEQIGDRPAYVIVGAREGQPPMRLWFDEQSSLLVREVRYAESPLGLNPTQIDYSDYRDQAGIKAPFRWTISQPRGGSRIQIEQMQMNTPMDDSKFSKPAVAANAEKQ
jgi:photosynthetic reaction center cytochrome c subunit